MAPTDELQYLKSLLAQLTKKIEEIEGKAKHAIVGTPAQQLRMILVGPPGAGTAFDRPLFALG